MMTIFIIMFIVLIVAVAAITKFHLIGPDLSEFDKEHPVTFETDYNSQSQQGLRDYLNEMARQAAEGPKSRTAQLAAARKRLY